MAGDRVVSADVRMIVSHDVDERVVLLRVGGITFELQPEDADDLVEQLNKHIGHAKGCMWGEEPPG